MDINIGHWKEDITEREDWRILDRKLMKIEFPGIEHLLEFKQNTVYFYVNSDYLNGLVNKVEWKYLICTQKYRTDEEFDELIKRLKGYKHEDWYHTDLGEIGDTTYLLGETESSYIIFGFDQDSTCSMIGRLGKDEFDFSQAQLYLLGNASFDSYWYERSDAPRFIVLPKPEGWIKG